MVTRYSISLPDDLGKRLNYYLSKHKKEFVSDSAFFQKQVQDFLDPGSKHYLSIAMLYLGYPIIILTILFLASIETKNAFYTTLSTLTIGFLIAGMYMLITRHKGKKI